MGTFIFNTFPPSGLFPCSFLCLELYSEFTWLVASGLFSDTTFSFTQLLCLASYTEKSMYIMDWIKNSWILRFVQKFKYILDELSFSVFLPFTYKEVRKILMPTIKWLFRSTMNSIFISLVKICPKVTSNYGAQWQGIYL